MCYRQYKHHVFLLSDKQKENEKLRESLSKKNAIIEHLHEDYECIKKENERLQKQIGKKEDETRYLTCEIYSSRNELNRYRLCPHLDMHLEKKIVSVMRMCLAIAININQVHRYIQKATEELLRKEDRILDFEIKSKNSTINLVIYWILTGCKQK